MALASYQNIFGEVIIGIPKILTTLTNEQGAVLSFNLFIHTLFNRRRDV